MFYLKKYFKTIVFIPLIILIGCSTTTKSIIDENSSNKENNNLESLEIKDCMYTDDFFNASKSIGLDVNEIKSLEFDGQWIQGTIYKFAYLLNSGTVYCGSDNSVESINFSQTKVYLKGFEPLKLSDYIINTGIADRIQTLAIQSVKKELNFPETADFPFLGWGYTRWENHYGVSGSVKAKNAFGVDSELKFSLFYEVEDNYISPVYFVLDGITVFGVKPENDVLRVELDGEENDSKSIRLVEGIEGQYGEEISLDGFNYIWYKVPTGKYNVYCEVNVCTVYLDEDKTIKNSEGYVESINVTTLRFSNDKSSQELLISSNQHIELTVGSKIRLEPIQ